MIRNTKVLALVGLVALSLSPLRALSQSSTTTGTMLAAPQGWLVSPAEAIEFKGEDGFNEPPALRARATAPLIEWHGAQRWVWAPLSDTPAIRQAAAQVGGQATLFRRPQQATAEQVSPVAVITPLDTVQQRIQHALKNEFDPAGIFGPRRINAHF